jgi:hypothetical protein
MDFESEPGIRLYDRIIIPERARFNVVFQLNDSNAVASSWISHGSECYDFALSH